MVMLEDDELSIVRIEPNGPVSKDMAHKHAPFAVPVRYVLKDGREFSEIKRYRLKRDAMAYASTLPTAPKYATRAIIHDGRFQGTVTTLRF